MPPDRTTNMGGLMAGKRGLVMGVANIVMRGVYAKRARRTTNYRSYAMERLVAYLCYLIGLGCADYNIQLFTWAFPLLMAIVMVHDTKRMLIDPPAAKPELAEAAA